CLTWLPRFAARCDKLQEADRVLCIVHLNMSSCQIVDKEREHTQLCCFLLHAASPFCVILPFALKNFTLIYCQNESTFETRKRDLPHEGRNNLLAEVLS